MKIWNSLHNNYYDEYLVLILIDENPYTELTTSKLPNV